MTQNAPIILENSDLRITVDPGQGGRITSLQSRRTAVEFLTQVTKRVDEGPFDPDAKFEDGPCAGVDECLPTIAPCVASSGPVPDHGDLWQLPWRVTSYVAGRELVMEVTAISRPLHVRRRLVLEGRRIEMTYSVRNVGASSTSFLYACHPLFAVDEGDRVLLPAEVARLRLDYSASAELGSKGTDIDWPILKDQANQDLDRVRAPEAGSALMLYTGRLKTGLCGIYRSIPRQALQLSFNPEDLPFLGVWLCYGGWPDKGPYRQYAVALEPTTAPFNSLAEAEAADAAVVLRPGQQACWRIHLEITEPGVSVP